MVLWTGSIQSLEFLKKSWNLPSNFQTWKKLLRFFKVCIDHLFGNLESRKRNYCYGKKSGESLEFWIQKSLRTLCEPNPSPHFVPYRYVTLHFRDRRGAAPLRYRNRAEITVLTCEQNCYTVWFLCRRKLAIRYSLSLCIGMKLSQAIIVLLRIPAFLIQWNLDITKS